MIGKVSRGDDAGGLLRYLFGPGRANEHTNPHVVASWDHTLIADRPTGGQSLAGQLAALLEQPLATLTSRPRPAVWHCSLRTAPSDRTLTDAEWGNIATQVLHRVGLAPLGDTDACRWVAVRHAEDHIHLAVTLARQDGRRARTSHDYARVSAACRALEAQYGLTATTTPTRSAAKRPTRAESEKSLRLGHPETPRQQLRRQVRRAALASSDFEGFVEHLRASGIHLRLRYSEQDPHLATGYAVAINTSRTARGDLVWFGGGNLAPQLSLPRLRQQWQAVRPAQPRRPAAHSNFQRRPGVDALRTAAAVLRNLDRGSPGAAAITLAAAAARGQRLSRR